MRPSGRKPKDKVAILQARAVTPFTTPAMSPGALAAEVGLRGEVEGADRATAQAW